MESIFFGEATQPLYGVIHEPEGSFIRDFAVLVCNPFGSEYMISHRCLRTVCNNLARAGVPCMRFDYRGTGDSSGDVFTLESAKADTLTAINTLAALSGVDKVKILGVRLGACIAAHAALESSVVKSLSLWDPVVYGGDYLNELNAAVTVHHNNHFWVNGFPINSILEKELQGLKLTHTDLIPGANSSGSRSSNKRLHFVLSNSSNEIGELIQLLNQTLKDQASRLVVDHCDLGKDHNWVSSDDFGSFLLPRPVLDKLQDGLLQEEAAA